MYQWLRTKYSQWRWNSKITKLISRNVTSSATPSSRITLSMCMKNEASNYLCQMLESCARYIDEAVIIDDASTDNSVDICTEILSRNNIKHKIIENESSMFDREFSLREKLWEETVKSNPDWILFLDADEIFEERFAKDIKTLLMSDPSVWVYRFRLFDMWDSHHFREDVNWNAHFRYTPFLLRYNPNFKYLFSRHKKNQHCGRMPENVRWLKSANSDLRLKHYGWADKNRRLVKYLRYKKLDPKGVYGNSEQYDSILDENVNLVLWREVE